VTKEKRTWVSIDFKDWYENLAMKSNSLYHAFGKEVLVDHALPREHEQHS
jgi:hypothetical protein